MCGAVLTSEEELGFVFLRGLWMVYIDILDRTLVPFINEVYPNGHRFVQDNDPKHKCKGVIDFIEDKNINWFHTPAESPDLNLIEI